MSRKTANVSQTHAKQVLKILQKPLFQATLADRTSAARACYSVEQQLPSRCLSQAPEPLLVARVSGAWDKHLEAAVPSVSAYNISNDDCCAQ